MNLVPSIAPSGGFRAELGGTGTVSHPEATTPELLAVYNRMDKVEQSLEAKINALEERISKRLVRLELLRTVDSQF